METLRQASLGGIPAGLPRPSARGVGRALLAWLEAAVQRSRQRRALRELNDDRLRDLGIARHEAVRESRKPFWQA